MSQLTCGLVTAVYVDVGSQGRNEVRPARRLLVVDNQKFRGERRRREKIPTSETNTARVFGFCHLGFLGVAGQQIIQRAGAELEYLTSVIVDC